MVARGVWWTLGALSLAGCIQFADDVVPAGGATTGVRFDRIEVAGACGDDSDPDVVHIWSVPLSGEQAILPSDDLGGTPAALAYTDSTVFFEPPKSVFVDLMGGNGLASLVGSAFTTNAVTLSATDVDYVHNGGVSVPSSNRLMVLVYDNSASLEAADPGKARVAFISKIMRLLPADMTVALVVFDGDGARVVAPASTDHLALDNALALQLEPVGGSPLVAGLQVALDEVINTNASLKPTVLLFTDGVTDEDAGNNDAALGAVMSAYARKPGGVPVVVAELLTDPEAGPSSMLQFLACGSGGSLVMIPTTRDLDAATLSTNDRDVFTPAIAGRLSGGWRIDARYDASGLSSGLWLIGSTLNVTIDGRNKQRRLEQVSGEGDSRIPVIIE